MVGHTHHDFLPAWRGRRFRTRRARLKDLSAVADFSEARGLFDLNGHYVRKVNISYLDEHLDGIHDWNEFIQAITGVDCLYIVDDRRTENKTMREFGEELTQRYLAKLAEDGIPAELVAIWP